MIRVFNHYLSIRLLLLTLLEGVVLFQSVVFGFQARLAGSLEAIPLMEAGVFTFIMLMSMSALGLYQTQAESFRTTVNRVLIAYGMSLLLISLVVGLARSLARRP